MVILDFRLQNSDFNRMPLQGFVNKQNNSFYVVTIKRAAGYYKYIANYWQGKPVKKRV